MATGKKLKQLRSASKRTLKQQGELFGVSMNTVYRWEHDLVMPRKNKLYEISIHYNVPLVWLMNDDEEYPESSINITVQQIISMLVKLSSEDQHRVLGYIECICMEAIK